MDEEYPEIPPSAMKLFQSINNSESAGESPKQVSIRLKSKVVQRIDEMALSGNMSRNDVCALLVAAGIESLDRLVADQELFDEHHNQLGA